MPMKPLLLIVIILIQTTLVAQNCKLFGTVVDASSNTPMPYANVVMSPSNDSTAVKGVLTDDKGFFLFEDLDRGHYKLKISFIGYQPIVSNNVNIEQRHNDLGKYAMEIQSENLGEIAVKGSKPPIAFKVDRLVVDAGSFPNADVAIDLLDNIPSVRVDLDGKITYRGDGVFKVFINGQSVANGVEKLRQIPVDKIERIEVITNPGAKYDAEGTAGIIQVVLKRNRLEGYLIAINAKASTMRAYDWNFSIEKNDETRGWYLNGYLKNQIYGKTIDEQQMIMSADLQYNIQSNARQTKDNTMANIEFGFNYDLTQNDAVDFSIYVDPLKRRDKSRTKGTYTETVSRLEVMPAMDQYHLSGTNTLEYQSLGSTFTYTHDFDGEHTNELTCAFDFSTSIAPTSEVMMDTKQNKLGVERVGYEGREADEYALETDILYEAGITDNLSLEAGINLDLNKIPLIALANGTFDDTGVLTPFEQEPLNQKVVFKQNIYASYASIKHKISKFEYQVGVRVEKTDRVSNYSFDHPSRERERTDAEKEFWDFFPSLHTMFSFSEKSQLALSYSRRISRANYWSLVPFAQYSTPYSYYKGNGNLLPMYSDALELNFRKTWGADYLAAEIFSHHTSNLIQSYSRSDNEKRVVTTPENVGSSWSTGGSVMTGVTVFKRWKTILALSLYSYSLKTTIDQLNEHETQFVFSTRWQNTVELPSAFGLKLDLNYNSPSISSQNRTDGYFYSDFSLKKGFKDDAWALTLVVSDVFNSKKYGNRLSTEGIDIHTNFDMTRYLSVKLSYTLNNQK